MPAYIESFPVFIEIDTTILLYKILPPSYFIGYIRFYRLSRSNIFPSSLVFSRDTSYRTSSYIAASIIAILSSGGVIL